MKLTMSDIQDLCREIWDTLRATCEVKDLPRTLVGIPRGGVAAALALASVRPSRLSVDVVPLDEVTEKTRGPIWVVDDIVVSGETVRRALDRIASYGLTPTGVLALCHRSEVLSSFDLMYAFSPRSASDVWIEFPWEQPFDSSPEDAVRRLIEYAGGDPAHPDLIETPRRVLAFYDEWRTCREAPIRETRFACDTSDLIVVRDIPVFSMCAHHLLPYIGTVHVGYLAKGEVLGLSKIPRIVVQEASSLSMQEDLCARINRRVAQAVGETSECPDVAVVMSAVHTCMIIRGPRAFGSETVTSSMSGEFRSNQSLRAEFMALTMRAKVIGS
jgi:GTP cyclohydrolase I